MAMPYARSKQKPHHQPATGTDTGAHTAQYPFAFMDIQQRVDRANQCRQLICPTHATSCTAALGLRRGHGAQAANLEDSFDAWWEAQHTNICAMAERDVLLSISCPYEDEDFVFLSSVMFPNAQVEDAADVHTGAVLYAAWFNPNIVIETLAMTALFNLAKQTQTSVLHLSGL